jgi:hypothetical protein
MVTIFVAVVTAIVVATFYIALPMRRAYYLELGYQQALLLSDSSLQQSSLHVRPLVEGVPQLFTWKAPDSTFKAWDEILELNNDGTATDLGGNSEAWIYLAGTAHDSRQRPNSYSHKWKRPDCDDPAHICDMFLDAFRSISTYWPNEKVDTGYMLRLPETLLRWVDCDVSPMLCSPIWGLSGANMLVHMKTDDACDYSMLPAGSCAVTWRWIGLPIRQAPWTRQIRIPLDSGDSTVVPAFPSAEEQMWNIMAYEGALEAMNYSYDDKASPQLWNSMTRVTPQNGKPPKTDNGLAPFSLWGLFRTYVDNPWDAPEWPYEIEIKCYVERYADILLGWWDNAAHLVQPRSCVGVAEKTRQKRREEADWNEWVENEQKKHEEEFRDNLDRVIREVVDAAKEHNARKEKSNAENEQTTAVQKT